LVSGCNPVTFSSWATPSRTSNLIGSLRRPWPYRQKPVCCYWHCHCHHYWRCCCYH
jgi:hypothetical protein